ncbi:MAG: hypothetical protein GY822_28445 [Deltaproteobacteria bacterium]|nr:hypothetical protein [Deltaproteobacteria bacterium]
MRLFDADTIDDVASFSTLADVKRYVDPGDVELVDIGTAGQFDVDHHRGSLSVALNKEELMELDAFFGNLDVNAGAALHNGRTVIPVNATMGMSVVEDGFQVLRKSRLRVGGRRLYHRRHLHR